MCSSAQWFSPLTAPTVPPTLRRMALLVSICILAACSKITAENYAKIKAGMSYNEVSGILGNPTSCDDAVGFKSCKWGDNEPVRNFVCEA